MTQNDKQTAIPKLRFSKFRNAPAWTSKELRSIAEPVSERAKEEDANHILTLSAEHGLVLQSEYFGKQVAGTNAERYFKIRRNDFVYNDRTTKASEYGTIKRLTKYPHGIVSPIYKCFRFRNEESSGFWEYYFESGAHEWELHKLANEGARAGRFNVTIERFLSTRVFSPETTSGEQQKIAECLSTLDELIEAESRKLNALKDHKKGLMQQLFPREGETRPRLRFPEFRSSPDWTTRRMNEIYAFLANNSFSRDRLNYVSGSIKNIHYGDIHKHYRLLFDVTREVVPYINDDALTSESQPVFCAEGDMVFADASEDLEDIGKCIEIVNLNNERVAAGLHTILARPKTRSAFARGFSGYLFSSKRIRAQIQKESQGTKVLGISAKRLANIELCFPVHVAEQERIADCLSSLDDLIAAQSERLEALRAHKRGLMQQLFPNPSEFES